VARGGNAEYEARDEGAGSAKRMRVSSEATSGLHAKPLHPRASLAPTTLEALVNIDELLLDAASPSDVFPQVAEAMQRVVRLHAAVLITRRDPEALVTWCASGDLGGAATARVARMALSDLLTGDPLAHAPSADSELSGIPERPIALPIARSDGETVLGILAVDLSEADDEQALAFLVCVARHLGRVLGRADLARSDADAFAHRLAELTTLMALRLDDIDASRTARLLARFVGSSFGEGCVIDLVHGDSIERFVHAPAWDAVQLRRSLDALVSAVVQSQEPVALELGRALAAPSSLPLVVLEKARRELSTDHLVCVPLHAESELLGAMTILGSSDRGPVPLRIARDVARRAGVAIANRDRYRKALSALHEKDVVLSTVAHDLKSPLGVILMTIYDLLRDRPVASRSHQDDPLELIERAANRMRSLVMGVLELSAIEGHALAIRPQQTELRPLLREALDAIAPIARAGGVELVDETGAVPALWIDHARIIQVLTNVLGNAIKFTPRGGSVTLQTDIVADDLVLTIVDTGRGIPADQLPHVFERFWRAPANDKTGSGLGLSISKSIVERSNGRIWIDSAVGTGTRVTITLPLTPRRQAEPPLAS
jgi:signal transduction histidine kinase